MIDGIKVENLGVAADLLLHNPQLQFLGKFDQATGAVIEEGKDSLLVARHNGLDFTAVRSKRSGQIRIELKGSLHKYHNRGLHNADDFTAQDLLAAVDSLVSRFGIDPFESRLNNVEFGVNVSLPFTAQSVLDALICYKGKPFVPGPDGPIYYQCQLRQYLVKVYNKGKQYGLGDNLLRFEIKVTKMEYLTLKGILLLTLADLTTVGLYPLLGELLATTFSEILFDEPSIRPTSLTNAKERELLLQGRNSRYWQLSSQLKGQDYERQKKQLQRDDKRFRDLLSHYRSGDDWQRTTATLIRTKWQQLTAVADPLLTQISDYRDHWRSGRPAAECPLLTGVAKPQPATKCPQLTGDDQSPTWQNESVSEAKKCPLLTGVSAEKNEVKKSADLPPKCPFLTGVQNGQMSPFDHNSLLSFGDNPINSSSTIPTTMKPQKRSSRKGKTRPQNVPLFTAATALDEVSSEAVDRSLELPTPSRPVTITQLRQEPALLNQLQQQHGRHKRKRQGHDEEYYQAHNSRNQESNPRNNLRRRLQRILDNSGLFPPEQIVKLTVEQRQLLDHWQGTPYQVTINRPAANQ